MIFNKKVLFYSLIFFIGFGSIQAQSSKVLHSEFEIQYGLSYNKNFNHVSGQSLNGRLSWLLFGLSSSYNFGNAKGLYLELDYVHKGTQNHDINYLVFSTLFTFGEGKFVRKVMIGPYGSRLFRYKRNGIVRNHLTLKYYDFGVEAGLQLKIPWLYNRCQLIVSPRVEVGLINFSYSHLLIYQLKISRVFKLKTSKDDGINNSNSKRRRR